MRLQSIRRALQAPPLASTECVTESLAHVLSALKPTSCRAAVAAGRYCPSRSAKQRVHARLARRLAARAAAKALPHRRLVVGAQRRQPLQLVWGADLGDGALRHAAQVLPLVAASGAHLQGRRQRADRASGTLGGRQQPRHGCILLVPTQLALQAAPPGAAPCWPQPCGTRCTVIDRSWRTCGVWRVAWSDGERRRRKESGGSRRMRRQRGPVPPPALHWSAQGPAWAAGSALLLNAEGGLGLWARGGPRAASSECASPHGSSRTAGVLGAQTGRRRRRIGSTECH